MLHETLIAPSFNSLFITGFFVLCIFFTFLYNYKSFGRLDPYHKLSILCLITIAVGVHGLIHLGLEINYGFNPYKWF